VVKAAGLPVGTGLHALRHYFASLLIRHGESVKTVQARLGHASAVETLDTYSPFGRLRRPNTRSGRLGARKSCGNLRSNEAPTS
jgi:integrase